MVRDDMLQVVTTEHTENTEYNRGQVCRGMDFATIMGWRFRIVLDPVDLTLMFIYAE